LKKIETFLRFLKMMRDTQKKHIIEKSIHSSLCSESKISQTI